MPAITQHRQLYTDHVGRKSNITRTRWDMRPEWLDAIKRPLRIVAHDQEQFWAFLRAWRLRDPEARRVCEVNDILGVDTRWPILVLPDAVDETGFAATCPIAVFRQRGGQIINVPESAFMVRNKQGALNQPYFPDDVNLVASTLV